MSKDSPFDAINVQILFNYLCPFKSCLGCFPFGDTSRHMYRSVLSLLLIECQEI